MSFTEKLIRAIIEIIATVLPALLLALPCMWLWNECLVSAIPAIHKVNYQQMFGIYVLVSALLKSGNRVSLTNEDGW